MHEVNVPPYIEFKNPAVPNRIVVILPNWIGDVVMATPTLRSLRQHFGPNAELIGVSRPYVREVLTGNSWLDKMVWHDPRSRQIRLRTPNVVRQLRDLAIAKIVVLPNSLRSGWLAWRSGARERIGYGRNGRSFLLTKAVRPPREGRAWKPISAIDYYLGLCRAMGVESSSRQPELYTTAIGELAAEQIWSSFGWTAGHSVIGINTGGAFGAAKHWPNQHSAQLALQLAKAGHGVLVFCGPKEVATAREIEGLARHPRVRSMADQDLSLETSKACLRRLELLVSTDSGPRHIAAAFDVPTVTLFGPIDSRWSHNYATSSIELFERLPCAPCGQRVCPLGHHRCMNDLTPDKVWSAVQALLGPSAANEAA